MTKIDFNVLNLKISPLQGGGVIKVGEFNRDDLANFQTAENNDRQVQSTPLDGANPSVGTSEATEDV